MNRIEDIIETRTGGDYQRDNFDAFLMKVSFSFSVPAIHVAGTNGKGSTVYFLSSLYQKAGYKVGRFSSPSLYEINESISINGEDIKDEDIISIVKSEEKLIKKYELSSFEILAYVAFTYFKQQGVDIAIIECGMGGEIDATNIFIPILSIITSISVEHSDYLGRSVSEIAYHKAGIIKLEVPVLIGDFSEDAENVVAEVAKNLDCKIYKTTLPSHIRKSDKGLVFDYQTIKDIAIPSFARYEISNALFAIDAALLLEEKISIKSVDFTSAFMDTVIPCRFELISKSPTIIIDGGHNPEAIDNFVKNLYFYGNIAQIHVIFACFRDKNFSQMLARLGELTDKIHLTTFPHPRARTQDDFFLFVDEYPFSENPVELFNQIRSEHPEDAILITGSLAFAAYMKKNIKL